MNRYNSFCIYLLFSNLSIHSELFFTFYKSGDDTSVYCYFKGSHIKTNMKNEKDDGKTFP